MTTSFRLGQPAILAAQTQLKKLKQSCQEITAAVLLTEDGFEVAALDTDQAKTSRLAAMGSSLAAISSAIAQEAGIAAYRRLIVESEEGMVAVTKVPDCKPSMILAVVCSDQSKLGQLIWSANHCCTEISKALKKTNNQTTTARKIS